MDVGNGGAVVFGQDVTVELKSGKKDKGLRIVDEMLFADLSVEEICLRIKAEKPWRIVEGESVVCVDPNTDCDEIRSIRRVFGQRIRVVRRERGDEEFPIETGIRCVQGGLRDAHGDVRIMFSRRALHGTQFGLFDGINRYRRNEVTAGRPVKDNSRDHALDALRYLVAERIPPEQFQAKTLRTG